MKQKKNPSLKKTSSKKTSPKPPPANKTGGISWGKKTKKTDGNIIYDNTFEDISGTHEVIETHVTKEQIEDAAKNPLNKKVTQLGELAYWKKRAGDAETTLELRINEITTLHEKLSPFKYEFTLGGSLVSVMVRPRAREVIPLTQ